MAEYFPTFFWVLRDFALQLVDSDGNTITQKQYLENSIKDQKGASDAIEAKNRIRRLIRHFFKERDCFTLVRPVEEEKLLQNLTQVQSTDLRAEFVDQINLLRSKTLRKVKPKQLKSKMLNGPMLAELASAYVQALNEGKVPTINTAWDFVQAQELERSFRDAIDKTMTQLNHDFSAKSVPLSLDQFRLKMKAVKKQAVSQFKENLINNEVLATDKGKEYVQRLKTEVKAAQDRFELQNTLDLKRALSLKVE